MIESLRPKNMESRIAARTALGILAFALVGYVLLNLFIRRSIIVDSVPRYAQDMSGIITAMRAYKLEIGEYPAGDNPRVMKALRGENPKKIVFFEIKQSSISESGEFVDPWGTAYRYGWLRRIE